MFETRPVPVLLIFLVRGSSDGWIDLRHNRFMVSRSPWRAPGSRPRRRRAPWVRKATIRRLAASVRRLARSVWRLAPSRRRLARSARRSITALRAAPPSVQVVVCVVVLLAAWALANWTYQAILKPTEL